MNDREIVNLFWHSSESSLFSRMLYAMIWQYRPYFCSVSLIAWITRNSALTKIVRRTAKKRGGGEAELALEELDACLSSGYDLEKEIEDRELSRAIDAFIGQLPEQEQLVFVSRYWFVATEREIAEKLGLSRSGVSAMLKRTRSKLRTYLLMEGLCTIRNE